jgi:protoporphyrinogen/coproporphyrinogen III oxidase
MNGAARPGTHMSSRPTTAGEPGDLKGRATVRDDDVVRVVVVGGGISGLSAAWRIAECSVDAEVLVLEAADAVGGKLRVASLAGVSVDVGAEALLARRPEGVELAQAAGLSDALIEPLTTAAAVYAGGTRHPLPSRTMLGVPGDIGALRSSGVLTEGALSIVDSEPSQQPLQPLLDDVAVGELVRTRLGDEVVDRLVEPLLGGVYAGRADQLSLRATMPALAAQLRAGGSLVRAAAAASSGSVGSGGSVSSSSGSSVSSAGSGSRGAASSSGAASSGPVFTSLAGGLGRLPIALAAGGRFAVRTGVTVRAITRTPAGFALDCGPVPRPELLAADAVVVATPPGKAARLLRDVAPAAGAELSTVETASMAIVTLAYRDVRLPAGSGLLVGSGEGHRVKALTLSSQKWPITRDGLTILRASIGRVGDTADLQRDDTDLIALVRNELPALIGVGSEPIDALVTRWGGALPQYAVGHVEKVARVRAAVAAVPGLAVCGATYDGVGIPACIASGQQAAERVLVREGQ